MNSLVKKMTEGQPIAERIRAARLWDSLSKKEREESRSKSVLPSYGRTALAFVRAMSKRRRGDAA